MVYPYDETEVSRLREADAGEVAEALQSARHAFDHGPWPRLDAAERKDILRAIGDKLRAHADELAWLEVLNTGIPVTHVRGQVQRMARNYEFFGEVASTLSGEVYTQSRGWLTYVTREPKGVAALIAPWNAPLALGSARVMAEAGIPAGEEKLRREALDPAARDPPRHDRGARPVPPHADLAEPLRERPRVRDHPSSEDRGRDEEREAEGGETPRPAAEPRKVREDQAPARAPAS